MAKKPESRTQISQETHDAIIDYVEKKTMAFMQNSFNLRERFEKADRLYQRELDMTAVQQRAKAANNVGDASKIQNVVIPVVQPQVEAMLDSLSETFLSGYPIFPIVSKPKMQAAALQMETIVGEQAVKYGWAAELLSSMRDGLKYNFMATECDWEDRKINTVETKVEQNSKYGSPEQTVLSGNAVKRIFPYNWIGDTRVQPWEVHTKGEYVGYIELISKVECKRRVANLEQAFVMNLDKAYGSGDATASTSMGGPGYYAPQINPDALLTSHEQAGGTNWDNWVGLESGNKIRYAGRYEWKVLYARIFPSQFKIYGPKANTAAVYKFIIINQKWCIFCKKLENAHDYLPIIVAQPHEDGLSWQSKGLADIAGVYQQVASGLFNSGLESQRRKVYDRILYDPSRINKADIEKTSSVARIPVKPEAYGKPLGDAVYAFPYRDEQVNEIFGAANMVVEMANVASGQNRVNQGQFQKGNKSRAEFETVVSKSEARPRMIAIVLEARYFTPLKEIIKLNTLQYQLPAELYNRQKNQTVNIDPVQLRAAALEFKVADGAVPVSKLFNTETLDKLLMLAGQQPQILQRFDIVGMIIYVLKLQGATWIDDFDIAQQQELQQQQQLQ